MHQCLQDYKLEDKIGQGRFGSVFKICPTPKCDKVIKIQKITSIDDFDNEVRIAIEMGENGVGPKVFDSWTCKIDSWLFGFTIAERMDITLGDWAESVGRDLIDELEKIRPELLWKVEEIALLGYLHNDLTENNIMIKFDNGEMKFYIVDFGDVVPIVDPVEDRNKMDKTIDGILGLLILL
jgi:serine/threonine protein kinase